MVRVKTFYTDNLEIYTGTQPEGPYVISNSSEDVVMRKIEPISGSGRNVTVDNSFTFSQLCEELLTHHHLMLVGSKLQKKIYTINPVNFEKN